MAAGDAPLASGCPGTGCSSTEYIAFIDPTLAAATTSAPQPQDRARDVGVCRGASSTSPPCRGSSCSACTVSGPRPSGCWTRRSAAVNPRDAPPPHPPGATTVRVSPLPRSPAKWILGQPLEEVLLATAGLPLDRR